MPLQKVGVLGSGAVGEMLSNGFLKHGYSVMRGSRDPSKLNSWKNNSSKNAFTDTFANTAAFGDLIVLAVKGTVAEEVVRSLPPESIKDKTIIDVTNPISDLPPTNGVLNYFTSMNESLMERLQKIAPDAHFVKSFNSVGNAYMVNPQFRDGKPSMFICGNNDPAKSNVREILTQFGWETEDMGKAEAARAIEPLCRLWCIPGFTRNEWGHAFKFLKL